MTRRSPRICPTALKSAPLVLSLLLAVVGCGSGDEDVAVEASDQWLSLLDNGDYQASWQQSAALFRKGVSAEDFAKQIGGAREQAGKLVSRKLRSAQAAQQLPNVPRGRYVVIQYDSVFQNQPAAVETVTEKFEGGQWRVVGYRSR